MASTKASNDRACIRYTDNNGNNWTISGKSVYALDGTDGAKYGAVEADGTEIGPLPTHFRPRRAQYISATGETRYVVCYTSNAVAFGTPGTTLTLDLRGVDTEFTKGKRTRSEAVNRGILPGH